jgi:hypothetical protein
MSPAASLPTPAAPLYAVISTDELARRPARFADDKALIGALVGLSKEMANRPEGILQRLVDAALGRCEAHSAGIGILEEDDGKAVFR